MTLFRLGFVAKEILSLFLVLGEYKFLHIKVQFKLDCINIYIYKLKKKISDKFLAGDPTDVQKLISEA